LDDIRARITKDGIRIYEDADFAGMRKAGRVAAEILDAVAPLVVPGATTGASTISSPPRSSGGA
jgi:methionyl aminopeptidase